MNPVEDRAPAPGLPEAIAVGRGALSDLTRPPPWLISGALERVLSVAASHHQVPRDRPFDQAPRPLESAAVAVRTACAHLSAGDLSSAHHALRVAHDALPRELPDGAPGEDQAAPPTAPARKSGEERRAEEVAELQRRRLRDHVRLDQAVGVLAQVGGTSTDQALNLLREHARHHRFVLIELAADIVAGRIDPTAVTAPAHSRELRAPERVPHRPG